MSQFSDPDATGPMAQGVAIFGEFVENAQGVTATVAVIGKKNEPLYLRLFDEYQTKELYFQSLVFVSLDVIDECVERKAMQQDMYLGFLCPIDEYQIYGYMTNSMIKFVVVLADVHRLQDFELRDFFQKVHAAYVEYLLNPFAPLDGDKIKSARFDAAIERHVATILERPPPAPGPGAKA
ncbi:hypothetical protein CTAYLR_005725 [Chrysophaeum taylorii]|uniref:Trafficking protein particle complex subunit 2-like protein n=1 Tax=Chrysophaeum taylorii TaxID=2483200 RepID=A0AAD7UIP8_9STRA|nr:hypothetical protein CTAYLR_005725 [Chrysophaeum taylorii]